MPFTTTCLDILNLACGRHPDSGSARHRQLVIGSCLAALTLAALWGVAAGSAGSAGLAIADAFKVPLVVALSTLCAPPAGLLALKLSGSPVRPGQLVAAFAAAILSGTLVLAVLAPLVTIYYHTSSWAGPTLAIVSVVLSIAVATIMLIRHVRAAGASRLTLLPVMVLLVLQVATLIQFVALASPLLPDSTPFEGGIDRLLGG